jgi:hypothetical protein
MDVCDASLLYKSVLRYSFARYSSLLHRFDAISLIVTLSDVCEATFISYEQEIQQEDVRIRGIG